MPSCRGEKSALEKDGAVEKTRFHSSMIRMPRILRTTTTITIILIIIIIIIIRMMAVLAETIMAGTVAVLTAAGILEAGTIEMPALRARFLMRFSRPNVSHGARR